MFLSAIIVSLLSFSSAYNETYEWNQFIQFQQKFSKFYLHFDEVQKRFNIFRENLRDIILHNSDHTQNFTMGINQFSDLTAAEFKSIYASGYTPLESFGCKSFVYNPSDFADSPSFFDWREKGVVNPVRDQGQCGSCWAFATTANAESVWAIYSGILFDLSEQYLVDCATGLGYFNMGCNGGMPDSAFKFMINNEQCNEIDYPYVSGASKVAGKCHLCESADLAFSSCYDVTPNDQIALKYAVTMNPVVIAIEADTRYFQSYSSGILDSASCGTNLDHAVEIVGYGEDSASGKEYWLVRNSWGESWGENGYVKILRSDSSNDIGICGVAAEPSFISV
jgi:C1A family cysteine protease